MSPVLALFLGVLPPAVPSPASQDPLEAARPFLARHCLSCHGELRQKGDQRFDLLGTDLETVETLETWQAILDQLQLGAMPPEEEPRPDEAELTAVVALLGERLGAAYDTLRSTGGETVLRRLNRFELRNTVRDLLLLEGPEWRLDARRRLADGNGNGRVSNTSLDPFRHFPDDEVAWGLDNVGQHLVLSDFFLGLMLEAAEESLERATHLGPRPALEARRFEPPLEREGNYSQSTPSSLERFQRELDQGYDAIFRRYWRFGRYRPDDLRRGVGTSGRYRISVDVSAHNQDHPWGEVVNTDPERPLVLGLHLVSHRDEHSSTPLAHFELVDDGVVRTYSVETWIDADWLPWIGWENGPDPRAVWAGPLLERFHPDRQTEEPDREDKEGHAAWLKEQAMAVLEGGYEGAHLRIHGMILEPMLEGWPPASHEQLYGRGSVGEADVADLLQSFAERAFRRPVSPEEVAPYLALVERELPATGEARGRVALEDLEFRYYEGDGSWRRLPDFGELSPTHSGPLPDGLVNLAVAPRQEHYALTFEGELHLPRAGEYVFTTASDDGCRLLVNGAVVVLHDGIHGASPRKGAVTLEEGVHDLRLEYFAFGAPNQLRLTLSGPGFEDLALSGASSMRTLEASDPLAAATMRALRAGYAAILCSPRFLYLVESPGALDDHALAARLSYFLWSSMPDDSLRAHADAGRLTDPGVLQAEVERMLADPRAEAFVLHFVERWLRLDKLSESPPEPGGPFRIYHDRQLERHLVAQTAAFFGDLLERNGPLDELIHSEHTFLNEPVATTFYGRQDVRGEFFQRVSTDDPRRGGVLTQPSVMTATANGVDTSPIVRGVWLLENILGTPPSPPPPDVEPLPPDLRGTLTLREQLERHRTQETCASCHRKIDPLGFAFENFNPIGQWRDRYKGTPGEIDASSRLSSGAEINGIEGLKRELLGRRELFARSLASKMLGYASGRLLEATDRGEVDRIVAALAEQGYGLRDLVHLVVASEIFRSK